MFVAVSNEGYPYSLHSYDGITWFLQQTIPRYPSIYSICYGGYKFVALCSSNNTLIMHHYNANVYGALEVGGDMRVSGGIAGAGPWMSNLNAGALASSTLHVIGPALTQLNAAAVSSGTVAESLLPPGIVAAVTAMTGGAGAAQANLNASEFGTGTVDIARLPPDVAFTSLAADGSNLTNLNACALASGTVGAARLPPTVTVDSIAADGSALTGLNACAIATGVLANARLPSELAVASISAVASNLVGMNACALSAGTVVQQRLPLAMKTASFEGDGAQLTALNAGAILSGMIDNDRLPTAIAFALDTVAALGGDGSRMTTLNASAFVAGTLDNACLPPVVVTGGGVWADGSAVTALNARAFASGTLSGARFPAEVVVDAVRADGGLLTNLNAFAFATGVLDTARLPSNVNVDVVVANGSAVTSLNASAFVAGTLDTARLPRDASVTSVFADGSLLTQLNAFALTSGTLAHERLPVALRSLSLSLVTTAAGGGGGVDVSGGVVLGSAATATAAGFAGGCITSAIDVSDGVAASASAVKTAYALAAAAVPGAGGAMSGGLGVQGASGFSNLTVNGAMAVSGSVKVVTTIEVHGSNVVIVSSDTAPALSVTQAQVGFSHTRVATFQGRVVLDGSGNLSIGQSQGWCGAALDASGDVRTRGWLAASDVVAQRGVFGDGGVDVSGDATVSGALDVANLAFTGELLQNGVPYLGSQWTSSADGVSYASSVAIGKSQATESALDVSGDLCVTGSTVMNAMSMVPMSKASVDVSGALRLSAMARSPGYAPIDAGVYGVSVTGSMNGSLSFSANSPFPDGSDGSVYFDGTAGNYLRFNDLGLASDLVSLQNSGTPHTCSVETWVYLVSYPHPTVYSVGGNLVSGGTLVGVFLSNGDVSPWTFSIKGDGKLYYSYYDTSGTYSVASSTGKVLLNKWCHVAMTVDVNYLLRFFIDGAFVSSSSINPKSTLPTGRFMIGSPNSPLHGYVTNTCVLMGTSPIYTAPFTPPTSPLTFVNAKFLLRVPPILPPLVVQVFAGVGFDAMVITGTGGVCVGHADVTANALDVSGVSAAVRGPLAVGQEASAASGYALDVSGRVRAAGFQLSGSPPPLVWDTSGSSAFVRAGSNVGVGTMMPMSALDVSGVLRATGFQTNGPLPHVTWNMSARTDQPVVNVSVGIGSNVGMGVAQRLVYMFPPIYLELPVGDTLQQTCVVQNQSYGNGSYVLTSSSSFNSYSTAHRAFDYTPGSSWMSAANLYTITWDNAIPIENLTLSDLSYLYVGSTSTQDVLGNSYLGEWLQLQCPEDIKLSTYTVSTLTSAPLSWVLMGSTDGLHWRVIDTVAHSGCTGSAVTLTFVVQEGLAFPCKYYRLVVSTVTFITGGHCSIYNLKLYGYLQFSEVDVSGSVAVSGQIAGSRVVAPWLAGSNAVFPGSVAVGKMTSEYALDVSGLVAFFGKVGIGCPPPAPASLHALDVSGIATFSSNVGVGVTNPSYRLDVSGVMGITGDMSALYSDDRLKTRVGPLANALEKVSRLSAFTYRNNALARSFGFADDRVRVGLSAQEVAAVLPEAVVMAPFDRMLVDGREESRSGERYTTVQYEKLVPLLIAGIQELSQKRKACIRHGPHAAGPSG